MSSLESFWRRCDTAEEAEAPLFHLKLKKPTSDLELTSALSSQDEQTSADASLDIDGERQHTGAMSHAFIKALSKFERSSSTKAEETVADLFAFHHV